MAIAKYEWEFFCLSKYNRELVSTEVKMCTHIEWGLNECIHKLVGVLELKYFVV